MTTIVRVVRCGSRRPPALVLLAALAWLPAAPGAAIAPHRPEGLQPGAESLLARPPELRQAASDADWSAARSAADAGFGGFVEAVGGRWTARWDRRTDRPALITGSGAAWIPGAGNDLTWDDVTPEGAPQDREATLALLERRARALLAEHPDLFRTPDSRRVSLELDPLRSTLLMGGRAWVIHLAVRLDGLPVEGAAVVLRGTAGNLVQLGVRHVGDALPAAPSAPQVAAEQALHAAHAALAGAFGTTPREMEISETLDEGSLLVLPHAEDPSGFTGAPGRGLDYRLCWRHSFRVADRYETWVSLTDAVSGERLFLFDDNRYACPPEADARGRVSGGVFVGPIEDVPEVVRGFPFALVEQPAEITTDGEGSFPTDPGTTSRTTLSGTFFDMLCDGCVNPRQADASRTGPGHVFMGLGGVDEIANGRSTKAERNCFYHLNVVRQLAAKHLDDATVGGWFSRNTRGRVNIDAACNAFFDGSGVNFFRSGFGCNNTGEIADVMQHEWGHGLDRFTGGGTAPRGEGLSDVLAFLSTHDSRLGPYFVAGNPAGLRDADEDVTGLLTVDNMVEECGFSPHCRGNTFSEAWWHLAENLIATHGEVKGWWITEKLFFNSLPPTDTFIPDQTGSTYDAVLLVDDDDGDLLNGTPNAADINEAFEHHAMVGMSPGIDAPNCAPPETPALTLDASRDPASGEWQVDVSWTAVGSADRYEVWRNDQEGRGADLRIGTVAPPDTSFVDARLTTGVEYRYRVAAFDAGGCLSEGDNQQSVTIEGVVDLALESFVATDLEGNVNGIPEPGEPIALEVLVRNVGTRDASAVETTLSTAHPGVTVTRASALLGDLAIDQVGGSEAPHLGIELDPDLVGCPETIPLTLETSSAEGCTVSTLVLEVGTPDEPCEDPSPRPRLAFRGAVVGDSADDGGDGDGDGAAEPGERVRLPIDVSNEGNRTATSVSGFMSLLAAPPGVVVSDVTARWPDVAVDDLERTGVDAVPHFEVVIPASVPCGSEIFLGVRISYDGPADRYRESASFTISVGREVEVVLWEDDLESGAPGWTHGGTCGGEGCEPADDWQLGSPTGASSFDPPAAFSGTSVFGNDLGDLDGMPSDGNYEPSVDLWLEAPPVDATGQTGVLLSFRRWLSVEDSRFDVASVVVNGFTLWTNPAGAGLSLLDDEWVYQEIDVSSIADNNPDVRVRFELTSDPSSQFGGWNVDDVRFFVRDTDCALVPPCIDPPLPEPAGNVLRPTGEKGPSRVGFAWSELELDPGQEARLYRGDTPDELDVLVSPAGLVEPAFVDPDAPAGPWFYRLVVANCEGEEGPPTP